MGLTVFLALLWVFLKMADEELRESGKRGQQVKGVGRQIALTYVLTIEDPYRFPNSREVGFFLGLRPGRRKRTMMVHRSA
jgi:transposase